ncbi:CopG family transcriptional regulator [Sorangium cellulosum]|uniref:Putative nickel-responsive regulator n=2 Tax=Sorangium cellulosum TaxID=56 RepID=A0A150TIA6_SORCE|nr:CopG family transcriptional regulator [Sorangium cellulosum]
MSDLVRFGVAMDRALLAEFDRRITAQGYENRSEALRDLVRADLTRAAWDEGAEVAATLTVVYAPEVRELVLRISELEEQHAGSVVSSLLVRLDEGRVLQVMALKGRGAELSGLAGQLAGAKGVLSCALTPAAALAEAPPRPRG